MELPHGMELELKQQFLTIPATNRTHAVLPPLKTNKHRESESVELFLLALKTTCNRYVLFYHIDKQ